MREREKAANILAAARRRVELVSKSLAELEKLPPDLQGMPAETAKNHLTMAVSDLDAYVSMVAMGALNTDA